MRKTQHRYRLYDGDDKFHFWYDVISDTEAEAEKLIRLFIKDYNKLNHLRRRRRLCLYKLDFSTPVNTS